MTIEIVNGDLIKAYISREVDSIAHCVNCQGIMGSGIAKQIKIELPHVYNHYRRRWEQNADKLSLLGTAQKVIENYLDRDWATYNLHAQLTYARGERQVNYGAIGLCLQNMSQQIHEPDTVVGFPYKMCSDRGGADWDIILEMIEFYFKDHNVRVYKL